MSLLIGIRRENKNIWERRVPLIPEHVQLLKNEYDIRTRLQPFPNRAFPDEEYLRVGAELDEDLSPCKVVLGVKEIPADLLLPEKIFMYFSHTIKGQPYNMPMLKRLLDLKSTLIDYECIKDAGGRRLVFFGRFAGLAGMVDTLHAFGQRLAAQGVDSPFVEIQPTFRYRDLQDVKDHILEINDKIIQFGFPRELAPLVVGFAGYGHVSQGAQEIFDELPVEEITPRELLHLHASNNRKLYKVVFKEMDMVEPKDPQQLFALNDYYRYPAKYRSIFDRYLPYLTILINGIYWDARYPRLVTKRYLRNNWHQHHRLQVVGDISCDINGAIECTEKTTQPDNPAFVYEPATDTIRDGFFGNGITVIAVDNLPAELPVDASEAFSKALYRFIPEIVRADFWVPYEKLQLPAVIKNAIIVYNGELTPGYKYLEKFIS